MGRLALACTRQRRAYRLLLDGAPVIMLIVLLPGASPAVVVAHPLDEFSQKTRLMFEPAGVMLRSPWLDRLSGITPYAASM